MPSNIPAPRVPMIDPRSGLINRHWYAFFLNLFDLADAGQNSWTLTDLQQAPPIIPYVPSSGSTAVAGRFLATLSTSTSLSGATTSQIVCNTVNYDDTGEYNGTTGYFTAAEDSVWAITGSVGIRDLPDQTVTRMFIRVNGVDDYPLGGDNASGANGRIRMSSCYVLRLSTGDTVTISGYIPAAGPKAEGGACTIYGLRLQ